MYKITKLYPYYYKVGGYIEKVDFIYYNINFNFNIYM